ncbi:MAG: heparinase II/III family protein, partial [Gemmatimonadota bacterium]|nr:heparinase II/III family protein [Gemmatimonadota bacterium]
HGHPDRLNLVFMHGRARWLDDLGTGSYVDPSLHWYRSTLAHNAPLVDGNSQARSDGRLAGLHSDDSLDAVVARAEIAPGVVASRAVVTAGTYFVDEVRWTASRPVRFELPVHFDAPATGLSLAGARLAGAGGLEDGFDFIGDVTSARVSAPTPVRLAATRDGHAATAAIWASEDVEWYVASAPIQPATEHRPFHLLRARGASGVIRAVWRWGEHGTEEFADGEVAVTTPRGVDRHVIGDRSWVFHGADGRTVDVPIGDARSPDAAPASGGAARHATPGTETPHTAAAPERGPPEWHEIRRQPQPSQWFPDARERTGPGWATFALGERHYRRTEEPWRDAGEPRAWVSVGADPDGVVIHVMVETPEPVFVPAGATNPYDNEHADVNGHGIQLYYATPSGSGAWMAVPDTHTGAVRVRPVPGWGSAPIPRAEWRRVAGGFEVGVRIPADARTDHFALDVIVNDASPGRVRRRGQLVMSGAEGEFAYLRGDRHDPARLLSFAIV